MTAKQSQERVRERIRRGASVTINGLAPLAGVDKIRGVRVYAVGQGDGITLIDSRGDPVLQIDYGGNQGNPFPKAGAIPLSQRVDESMPVDRDRLVMLTHWDLDHWCSAPKGSQVMRAQWLVPRQMTSPAAVEFASRKSLARMSCIPEAQVGMPHCFRADNGDELWWEKIGRSATNAAKFEDCNKTGVAFSLVRRDGKGGGQVILLPGDAPFDLVGHYRDHLEAGLTLTGLVAFHHGARTHWTKATRELLRDFSKLNTEPVQIVFSCARRNSYKHPYPRNYKRIFGDRMVPRRTYQGRCDIDFV